MIIRTLADCLLVCLEDSILKKFSPFICTLLMTYMATFACVCAHLSVCVAGRMDVTHLRSARRTHRCCGDPYRFRSATRRNQPST